MDASDAAEGRDAESCELRFGVSRAATPLARSSRVLQGRPKPPMNHIRCATGLLGAAASVALAAAWPPALVQAHHSRAMFDTTEAVVLGGSVKSMSWRNPHVYFEVDVTSGARQSGTWMLESGSVAGLVQEGWSENTVKVGDQVQVEVYPHKDSSRKYAGADRGNKSDGARYTSFIPGAARQRMRRRQNRRATVPARGIAPTRRTAAAPSATRPSADPRTGL